MQFIKPDINIDFIGKRKIAFAASSILILIGIISLIVNGGPKFGVDFAGGTEIQVQFKALVDVDNIKAGLSTVGLEKSTVQEFESGQNNEYLVRTNKPVQMNRKFSDAFEAALKKSTGQESLTVRRVDMVGPKIGKDLRAKALFVMFYALLFITIYISGRFELKWMLSIFMAISLAGVVYGLSIFNVSIPILIGGALAVALALCWFLKLKYAMGAIVALIHDVLITVGIFSIFGKEFSLPIIAALLTIIGYSLNDTIIVFDRIRENLKKNYKVAFSENINKSINETLARTILTSITTLLVVIILFVFGGGTIHNFAFAMIVGVLVGTYSSIYVASPIVLLSQEIGSKS